MTKYRIIGNQLYRIHPTYMDQIGIITSLDVDKNRASIYYTNSFNPFLKSGNVIVTDMGDIEVT